MKLALISLAASGAMAINTKVAPDFFPMTTSNGDNSCYVPGHAQNYRGLQDSSSSGRKCQVWADAFPHKEAQDESGDGLGNHRYCRAPDGGDEPWCYTMDPAMKKEACGIPKCEQNGPWARNYKDESGALSTKIGAHDCECAQQLYGTTTDTRGTKTRVTLLQKGKKPDCACAGL